MYLYLKDSEAKTLATNNTTWEEVEVYTIISSCSSIEDVHLRVYNDWRMSDQGSRSIIIVTLDRAIYICISFISRSVPASRRKVNV